MPRTPAKRAASLVWLLAIAALGAVLAPRPLAAIGARTAVDLRVLSYAGGRTAPRETAMRRLAWEVRQRTSVETLLEPTTVRLDQAGLFESPLIYWSGDRAFPPLSEAEVQGLERFVEFGGFVLIDDASPTEQGFDESIRRELARAFGSSALTRLPATHTVYRSFYLIRRPFGRIEGNDYLEAVEQGGRAAVIYSRHDLGGAWDRDNLGNWYHEVMPGKQRQREMAFRLGVNLVLYALCLDYKDDQVHSPFIMRRRGQSH